MEESEINYELNKESLENLIGKPIYLSIEGKEDLKIGFFSGIFEIPPDIFLILFRNSPLIVEVAEFISQTSNQLLRRYGGLEELIVPLDSLYLKGNNLMKIRDYILYITCFGYLNYQNPHNPLDFHAIKGPYWWRKNKNLYNYLWRVSKLKEAGLWEETYFDNFLKKILEELDDETKKELNKYLKR